MPDITAPGIVGETQSGAITSRPAPGRSAYQAAQDDDGLLARLLVTSWMLATGRSLRDDVPPALLSEQELIEFWADDQTVSAGLARSAGGGPAQPAPPRPAISKRGDRRRMYSP